MRLFLAIVLAVGCGAPATAIDASPRIDGGVPDASPDAAGVVDASFDASRIDASVDAGGDAPGSVDAPPASPDVWGSCDLFAQTGCAGGEACRRADDGTVTPHIGPPACEPAGVVMEGDTLPGGGCRNVDGTDACAPGLFCFGTCLRYCDPDGSPCPDIRGSPQRCDTERFAPADLGYCTPS